MRIDRLALENFRSYAREEIELHPARNVIRGANAAGKTNLLEAIWFLSTLRPIRPVRERELLRQGEDLGGVAATLTDRERTHQVDIRLRGEGRRELKKNGIKQTATGYLGTLRSVLFTPADLLLLSEGSSARRRLMDQALCQLRPRYAAHLMAYNRCLEQKNRILRSAQEKPSLLELLPAYNEQMALHGAELIASRHRYMQLLSAEAGELAGQVSGGHDRLEVGYTTLSNIPDPSLPVDQLAQAIRDHQQSHSGAERASGTCLSGPHKDNLVFTVNGLPAKGYASQGQTRTVALALKLAERELFYRDTGEYPLLLLDDVLSELDFARQNYVLNRLEQGQVFIASCTFDRLSSLERGREFTVENSRIVAVRDL